jgi:ATP-dependent exoDNAse (exonuclease V) beta subunit
VQDLLAITRALESHADRVAWLSLLRAPWCGLTLADLLALVGDDTTRPLWQAMQDDSRLTRLSADGRERLTVLQPVLARALDDRGRTTRRRAVESVWLALGGPAFVVDASDLDDAEVYLDLLETLDRPGELLDTARLEERVAKLYALPDAAPDNTVQLMTIHKAKGLEFDTVILPGLGRRPRNESKALLLWAELPRTRDRVDLLLAPLRPSGEERDPIYDYLQALEKQRRRHEDTRLLYVAATRARRRLHLLGHTGVTLDEGIQAEPPAAGTLLATLWPVVADRFQAAATTATSSPKTPPTAVNVSTSLRRPLDWRCPPPPDGVAVARETPFTLPPVEYDWAGETARHVGSVMHRWLLRMAEEGLASWNPDRISGCRDAVMAMLRRHGVANAEITQAADDVLTGLRQTLDDPRGRWLLDSGHEAARSEYALSGLVEGRVVTNILDRTFIDASGTRWIVDYKTGAHTGGGREQFLDREQQRYAPQLERYAQLLGRLDARPIRLGLYFPSLGGWREWPART